MEIVYQEESDGEFIRIWEKDIDGEITDEILMTREMAIVLAKDILEMLEPEIVKCVANSQ